MQRGAVLSAVALSSLLVISSGLSQYREATKTTMLAQGGDK
jgi:hypothetical protein